MASFGRKAPLGAAKKKVVRKWESDDEASDASGPSKPPSAAFLKLQEEEAERERIAEEKLKPTEEAKPEPVEEPVPTQPLEMKPNPKVFLEISVYSNNAVGKKPVEFTGRMIFELFADRVPKTVENFRCLCTGEFLERLHYKGSLMHRIIPGFMAQGGDIANEDGTGGESIYGACFDDEGLTIPHDSPGMLSMANCGRNTNSSQFFITFKPCPTLDRRHVAFGKMLCCQPLDTIRRLEMCGTEKGGPKKEVRITDCGELSPQAAAQIAPAHSMMQFGAGMSGIAVQQMGMMSQFAQMQQIQAQMHMHHMAALMQTAAAVAAAAVPPPEPAQRPPSKARSRSRSRQ